MSNLKFCVFGIPRFERDGQSVPFQHSKGLALLAYLVATRQPQSRAVLCDLLWPEFDVENARGNLRRELSLLNRILPADTLIANRTQIAYNLDSSLEVDLLTFRTYIPQANQLISEVAEATIATLQEAVRLYHDDFLAGFAIPGSAAFDDWVYFEAESLRRAYAAALQTLLTWFIEKQQYPSAINYARRWMALDPLHEIAQRALINVLALAGEYKEALRQYQSFVDLLHEELAVLPETETFKIVDAIRTRQFQSLHIIGAELENILQGQLVDYHHSTRETGVATPLPISLRRSRHNLPTQTTPFVGREFELRALAKLLNDPQIRLITILAPGGMGKTWLAVESGQHHLPNFQHGVYIVELARLSNPINIITAVAEAVGYQLQSDGREPKQQVLDFLSNKEILLLMDNYEHLLDGATLVSDMLQSAPQLKILATSRQRLNQSGETIFNLQGMDFPTWKTLEEALEYAPVKLFLQGARRARPDFELNLDNMEAIARICKQVQGMPLAIVLAASWVVMLSPEEIADELSAGISFLKSELSDLPERQRKIHTVLDHSWDLMTPSEQQVFMRLSVFRGGFTRNAAQTVTGANLQQLMLLVNKSLLNRGEVTGRYEIHELLRQYGEQQLEVAGETRDIRDTHAKYYADAMYKRENPLKGHQQLEAMSDITSDFENVRTAWVWAVLQGHYDVVDQMQESLSWYCILRTRQEDGFALLNMAVKELSQPRKIEYPKILGRLLSRLALIQDHRNKQAHAEAEAGLQIAKEHGELQDIALALFVLSTTIDQLGQPEQAWVLAEQSLALFREAGDKFGEARALQSLASLAVARLSRFDTAEQFWTQVLVLYRNLGNKFGIASILHNLGYTEATRYRRFDTGEAYLHESITLLRELRTWGLLCLVLENLALVLCYQGKFHEAEKTANEAVLISREANSRFEVIFSLFHLVKVKIYQEDYAAALKLSMEARNTLQANDSEAVRGYVNLSKGLTLCGVGDYAASEKILNRALHELAPSVQVHEMIDCVLGLSLVLAFHRQDNERALEIASLLLHHPMVGFWDVHPLAKRLMLHLHDNLTTNVYKAAWERGKLLNFETVVKNYRKNSRWL
jgi:predicted ATPase/DNA-binding SARP family transcriptional activator